MSVLRRSVSRAALVVALATSAAGAAQPAAPSAAVPAAPATSAPRVIPALQRWTPTAGAFRLGTTPRIVVPAGPALDRTARLFARELSAVSDRTVAVRVGGPVRRGDIALSLGLRAQVGREGYRMYVGRALRITGRADAGVFYGTRTVLQLIRQGTTIPSGTALDWPRYPERGLMFDLGRVPFTAAAIRRQVQEMAYLKLNYLHLHLSDDGAFRIESDRHPEIVSKVHLSKKQVRSLVALARRNHVAVVPEIDMPGHMGGILAKHPELQLRNSLGQADASRLDITNPAARAFARDIVEELLPLFPGRWWHLGADEYIRSAEYPLYGNLRSYAQAHYGPSANAKDAVHGFVNWLNRLVRRHGKVGRMSHDDYAGGNAVTLDRNLVVEWWTNVSPLSEPISPTPQELVDDGHLVMNRGWWPTYYNSPGLPAPDMGEAYAKWWVQDFYGTTYVNSTVQLPPDSLAASSRSNVGSELSIWGDGPATDPAQMIAGLLPRLRLLAQKTWESPQPPAYSTFTATASAIGHAPH